MAGIAGGAVLLGSGCEFFDWTSRVLASALPIVFPLVTFFARKKNHGRSPTRDGVDTVRQVDGSLAADSAALEKEGAVFNTACQSICEISIIT